MMFLEYLVIGLRMFGIPITAAVIGWMIAFGIKKWFSKKCRWSHNPKYVKLKHWTNYKCTDHWEKHTDSEPLWATIGIWVCQEPGCNGFGEKCFGSEAWWKIEHGQVIIDEKKMTDPGEYQTPKQAVEIERKKRDAQKGPDVGDAILRQMKEMELRVICEIEKGFGDKKKDETS